MDLDTCQAGSRTILPGPNCILDIGSYTQVVAEHSEGSTCVFRRPSAEGVGYCPCCCMKDSAVKWTACRNGRHAMRGHPESPCHTRLRMDQVDQLISKCWLTSITFPCMSSATTKMPTHCIVSSRARIACLRGPQQPLNSCAHYIHTVQNSLPKGG